MPIFGLEEVMVTAQRREENLQEVPLSVSTFTAVQIKELNITEAKNYLQMTPNVNLTEEGETGQRAIGLGSYEARHLRTRGQLWGTKV